MIVELSPLGVAFERLTSTTEDNLKLGVGRTSDYDIRGPVQSWTIQQQTFGLKSMKHY